MRKHASQEHDTFFDIKGEIRSIVGAITEAQVERDSELVSELTDELIALIDKHEDKYELYAQVIKNSINGEQKRREIAYPSNAEARALKNLAELLKQRLKDDMKTTQPQGSRGKNLHHPDSERRHPDSHREYSS